MKKLLTIIALTLTALLLVACEDKKPLTPIIPGESTEEPIEEPIEETPIEETPIEDEVEDKEDEIEVEDDNLNEFVIANTGSETTKLNNEDNDAMLGYDKNHINVETNFVGSYSNAIGLNKDGTIRLYGNRADGEGSELTITISDKVEVSELIINFSEITGTTAKSNGLEVRIDGVPVVLDGFNFLGNEVLEVKNAGMRVITIKNVHEGGTANGQIWIKNITLRK